MIHVGRKPTDDIFFVWLSHKERLRAPANPTLVRATLYNASGVVEHIGPINTKSRPPSAWQLPWNTCYHETRQHICLRKRDRPGDHRNGAQVPYMWSQTFPPQESSGMLKFGNRHT